MQKVKKPFITIILLILIFSVIGPFSKASTIETSNQIFTKNLSKEINLYIKKYGGDITLEYQDLITGEKFQINSTKSRAAASTIKLPLVTYIMELADTKKLDLNQKLTYKRYHYYGGSGVIQKDKVGTKYTIKDLVKKAIVYSDNIAFIMLKEKVGQKNFINYMKKLGGTYTYPNGQNKTSAHDLAIYAKHLYEYAQKSQHGKELISYLKHTVYNETIPKGIKGAETAHKVGMIPMSKVSNDVGIIYDDEPFILAITTNKLPYEKSKKVISDIASIIYKYHKIKDKVAYFTTNKDVAVYQSMDTKKKIGALKRGESSKVTQAKGAWLEIQFGTGKGYVQKRLVTCYPEAPKMVTAKSIQTKSAMSPIRITFAGDLMMDWSVKSTINKKGVDYPFLQVKKEVTNSDFAFVNLETAVTNKTAKFPKEYNFKSYPTSLKGVKNAGFDMVTLANNHSMDFKGEGLIDTMKSLKKYQLPYIGAGYNSKEAYTAKTYTIKGKKVSFLAFSRVLPDKSWVAQSNHAGIADGYNLNLITSTIKKAKKNSDYLFVYLHWGVEENQKPETFQRTWARKMIDSGADAVIGSHSHVLQGFEYYKGRPIAYSLGNFLFPDYVTGDKAQTGLLNIEIDKNKFIMNFTPYKIYKDQIIYQSSSTKKKVWSHLQSISYGVSVKDGKITMK